MVVRKHCLCSYVTLFCHVKHPANRASDSKVSIKGKLREPCVKIHSSYFISVSYKQRGATVEKGKNAKTIKTNIKKCPKSLIEDAY